MSDKPIVMGILNTTPDSFFDGGSYLSENQMIERVEAMVSAGVSVIDVGGFSTKPHFAVMSEEVETERVLPAVQLICRRFPQVKVSVDTFRANVARKSIAEGAAIINDISGGNFDAEMFPLIADNQHVDYVLMHCAADSLEQLHQQRVGEELVSEVSAFFERKLLQLNELGIDSQRVILDPGFGFGKTIEQNFALMYGVSSFAKMGRVLVGISRKSMIFKSLGTTPQSALTGTIALNMIALQNGAAILRVHDVREAVETIEMFCRYRSAVKNTENY